MDILHDLINRHKTKRKGKKEPMRLIDADELKKHTVKVRFSNAPECGKFDAVVVYEIDIAPTIDPTASIVEQDLLKMGK